MADRTVRVRLVLDSTAWAAGTTRAGTSMRGLSTGATAAAATAERAAQRTATAVAGTFAGMAAQGTTALAGLDAAAARSSQALASSTAAMSRETAAAASAATRATTGAATAASRAATAATRSGTATAQAAGTAATATLRVSAAAGEIPAAFRAASAAGTTAMGRIDAAAAATSVSVAQASAGMSAATAAAAAGTADLSLATRLALAEAATASAATAAAATAAGARTAAATASLYGRTAAGARAMGASVVAGATNSQKSLKAARSASLVLVAAFGLAVYASSKFETAMSGVKAATQAGAKELLSLRQAAIQAGSSTQYSATQAANAETELAKAGVSTADILGGALKGTLSLAAAGQMDVADSAVVAAKAMNSFGLSGADMAHIADVIAAAAGKSATDVHGMSLAFAQSSLLAHQTGLTLEQTAGTLALFAQNGLVGSDAGTSLKQMLMSLTPQSAKARAAMDQLGFSAYDAQGNFVGLSEVARRMQKSFGGLSPEARNAAMGVIFGSDAIRAATIVSQAGAAGINTWTQAANDQGYAARYAATQADNLQGDLRRLKSAIETALIQSGSAANGVLRDMAQALNAVVRWYSELPPGVQKSVTVLAGLAGVVGLVGSGLLLALPRIAATRRELANLGVTAGTTRSALMTVGKVTAVLGALTLLSYATKELQDVMKDASPSTNEMTASVVDFAQKGKVSGALAKEYGKDLGDLTDSIDALSSSAANNKVVKFLDKASSGFGLFGKSEIDSAKDSINGFDEALAQLVASGSADTARTAFEKLVAVEKEHGKTTKDVSDLLPLYADALAGVDTQNKLVTGSQKQVDSALKATADQIQDTRTEAEKLTDALDALNGINIDVATSEIGFRQSLADLGQSVKDNGTSMTIATDKGRKLKQSFLDTAQAALRNAEAVAKKTGSQEAGNKALTADIALLKKQMDQYGFSKDAIDKLLAAYLKVPASVTTKVTAKTGQALGDLQAVQDKLARTKGKSITVGALTDKAEKALTSLGYKATHLKNGKVRISVPDTGAAQALQKLQDKVNALEGTYRIKLLTENRTIYTGKGGRGPNAQADGSVLRSFASGGTENHVAQIAPAGTWRVWAEDETGGEAYIPLAASKRQRSRRIAEETVRLLGGKGVAWYAGGGLQRYAGGGLATYTPTGAPVLGGTGDAMDRYNSAVQHLKDAWAALSKAMANQATQAKQLSAAEAKAADVRRDGARKVGQAEASLDRVRSGKHTTAQLAAAEDRLTNARAAAEKANKAAAARTDKERADARAAASGVGKAKGAVGAADAALGMRYGSKAPTGFDLTGYQEELGASLAATTAWRASLTKIGKRGGAEIRDILEGMGQDGYALVQSLAKASDRQFADIVAKLKATSGVASASLADFRNQVNASTKVNAQFASDLQKLASEGYGELAQALAAQGDAAAQSLAHQAVGNKGAAAAANTAAKNSTTSLTGDDLANSLTMLATLRGGTGRGYADLIGAGLDVATIKALVPKMMQQISALPAAYRTEFLREWAGQGGVTAMARGGILTRPTAVVAAEAGATESWIPWDGSARSAALLSATAAGMGYQLVPAGRWGGTSAGSGGSTHIDRSQTLHLHGADRSLAEQRADLLRHMAVLG